MHPYYLWLDCLFSSYLLVFSCFTQTFGQCNPQRVLISLIILNHVNQLNCHCICYLIISLFCPARLIYWDTFIIHLQSCICTIFISGTANFCARLNLTYLVLLEQAHMKKLLICSPLFSLSGYVVQDHLKVLVSFAYQCLFIYGGYFINVMLIQRVPLAGHGRHCYWHLEAIYGNISPTPKSQLLLLIRTNS